MARAGAQGAARANSLTRFEWGCIAVVVAAFVVRATFILEPTIIWDSAWFLMLARSFGETGTFLLRWSDPAAPQYSGYWPPLFPIFVSPFVRIFGASYGTLVLASIVASALLVGAVFYATRDLFDRRRAFLAAAIIAASPAFYTSDSKGMSESLLGLFVALTVWAFLKSLDRPAWLPVAAGFAALAYLGKATLGLPLVAAGVVALGAWRVYTRGWRRVATSPFDVGVALAGVVGMVALAATRTERLGGIGLGIIDPLRRGILGADCSVIALGQSVGPHCWAIAFPLKIVFAAAFLFVITLPLSLQLPALLRAPRSERTDALWLAVLLPLVAGALFTSTFLFTEKRPFVDFDNIRYLTPAIVPFVWLLLPHTDLAEEPVAKGDRLRRTHARWYWGTLGALLLVLVFNPLIGTENLARFVALCVLAFVVVALSLGARATRYHLAERRVGSAVELRAVPAARDGRDPVGLLVALLGSFVALVVIAPFLSLDLVNVALAVGTVAAGSWAVVLATRRRADERAMLLVAAAILIAGGWFYSAWYIAVAFGLPVALATTSSTRRALAMCAVLLASATPNAFTVVPIDEVNERLEALPEGTLVGMTEIVVFPAAAAPDNVAPRVVDLATGVPEGIDVVLAQGRNVSAPAGFRTVGAWDYHYAFSPTLHARVWIEREVLGTDLEYPAVPGFTLLVREGSPVEPYLQATGAG